MKRFGKLLSVVLAVVMAFSSLCIVSSAVVISESQLIKLEKGSKVKSGAVISRKSSSSKGKTYKIIANNDGYLSLQIESTAKQLFFAACNADGKRYEGKAQMTCGTRVIENGDTEITLKQDARKKKINAVVSFKINKGTNYVEIYGDKKGKKESGESAIKFVYPASSSNTSNSSGEAVVDSALGRINALTVTLKKGSTLQLGATTSGRGAVKWTTSKRSVATVTSKGKVTAKAKGTAIITAKLGSTSFSITVKVV